ncbi:MAG TPA: glycosyltransferase family 2 protein [Vicinamibacterales bacterium]|nr:glycosyltransferase family 2 protein [Vicinamibacterales bacterium]
MTEIFWLSVAVVTYVYVGYPALLRLWARLRPKPYASSLAPVRGGVSIVIAARDEGARLAARIDNLLSLRCPSGRRQIIVVCDGCTDDTDEVLARYADVVEAVRLRPSGKALSLNAGVARARFDIVVFADARQVFAPDALRELVAPFEDPTVGAVTGELLLDCESALFSNRRATADRRRGHVSQLQAVAMERRIHPDRRRTILSTIADGVGYYWRYEKQLRRLESCIGSTLGATGAIYAMRRALWRPLPADTLLDDVLAPMRVVMAGFRVVFNERARAFDRATVDADTESRRKIRTLAGNYQILRLEPALLLPWRNPVWLQYVSHKLGRLLVPYAMLAIFSASILLSGHAFYRAALGVQVAFYLLAGYGAVLELTSREQAPVPRSTRSRAGSTRNAAREVA